MTNNTLWEQLKPRKCRRCKAQYQPIAEHQKYCSIKCRVDSGNARRAERLAEFKKFHLAQRQEGAE